METTEKIGLTSIPYKGTKRTNYIKALENKIIHLPLSKTTKEILSLKLKVAIGTLDNPNLTLQETFLFLILDRGVIMNGLNKPVDWTNSFTINESSKEMSIFKENNITATMVEQAFAEVNNFLKGFSFIIDKCGYELGVKEKFWFICYSSETFNKSHADQLNTIMRTTKE